MDLWLHLWQYHITTSVNPLESDGDLCTTYPCFSFKKKEVSFNVSRLIDIHFKTIGGYRSFCDKAMNELIWSGTRDFGNTVITKYYFDSNIDTRSIKS